jgi:hypothetical protein
MLQVKPSDSDIASIKTEYSGMYVEYPLLQPLPIPVNVYVTQQQFIFWNDVSPYLPYGSKLIKAYVRPDDYALEGLNKLKELNPSFDFDGIVVKRAGISGIPSDDTTSGSDFFKSSTASQTSSDTTSDVNKTYPNLNGKFDSYYLHQFDYDSVKSALSIVGYIWELPFSDSYQKGLTMAIDLTDVSIDHSLIVSVINNIIQNNDYLNASNCVLSGTSAIVTFVSSEISVTAYEFGIINVGPNSNVSDCFSEKTLNRIYANLKTNGYGDLDESVKPELLKGLPHNTRKKGTALAKAIRDSMIEVLGGSEGVISVLQASTNEYLMALINGLLAANNVLYDELDRVGGGNVKKKAQDAFESGMNKSIVSKNVSSLLNNGLEINKTTGKSLIAVESSEVVSANANSIQIEMDLSRSIEVVAGSQAKS